MKIWFTRSNGLTPLSNPNKPDYVKGEPPEYPKEEYNYRLKCLHDGFARIGWPNTGDLSQIDPKRLAPEGYSLQSIEAIHRKYLLLFRTIKAGDLMLIPADESECEVHVGLVLTKEKVAVKPYIEPRPIAYFHYVNIPLGDWYECAHRVNVKWAITQDGDYAIMNAKSVIGIAWIKAFSEIRDNGLIYQFAKRMNLF